MSPRESRQPEAAVAGELVLPPAPALARIGGDDLALARALARHAPDLHLALDSAGTIRAASDAALGVLGRSPASLRGLPLGSLAHPDDAATLAVFLAVPPPAGSAAPPLELRLRHREAGWRQFEIVGADLRAEPSVRGIVLSARDVTARRDAERRNAAFLALGQRLGAATSAKEAARIIAAVADELLGWDAYFLSLYAAEDDLLVPIHSVDEIGGRRVEVPETNAAGERPGPIWRRVLTAGGLLILRHGERDSAQGLDPFGDVERLSASLIYVPVCAEGAVVGILSIQSYTEDAYTDDDVALLQALADHCGGALERVRIEAALRASEARLRHQATHDTLTGLANRALFQERLAEALAAPDRRGETVGILFVDLDRFKVVNDSLGHEVGDALLVAVAGRLRAALRQGDSAARLGGDEFTILLPALADADAAARTAARIAGLFAAPFPLGEREVVVTASVGISLGIVGRDRPGDLLRHADIALYRAKNTGRARHALFDAAMGEQAVERLELEAALRRAIEREELQLHYQPQIALATGRLAGMEALVRWPRGAGGIVAPAKFIPLAEETGLILPLGRWVLREACQQARLWRSRGPHPDLTISVNLSVAEFGQPGLAEAVASILGETGLEAAALELEITERVLMGDVTTLLATLRDLKALGVRLAIDDFGTGYSSLGLLRRFPVDSLKVDGVFVDGLGRAPEDEAIVSAMIGLGRALGLQIVAEGVESPEQLAILRDLGCHLGQGHHFAPPGRPLALEPLFVAPPRPFPRRSGDLGRGRAAWRAG